MSAFTYPGVYIEEPLSGVHTITGVATSIAAFIGWANQGPVDEAVLVQSWSDFQNQFGGLNSQSYLGYAVSQFFANGGQQAYIVRIVWDGTLTAAPGTTPVACATASASGVGGGAATITATDSTGKIVGTSSLNASAATLTTITIMPAAASVEAGDTQQFTAMGNYSDGTTIDLTALATWSVTPTTVATIGGATGLLTAVAVGSATVKAAFSGVTSNTTASVTAAATLTSIAISPSAPPTLYDGQTLQFTAIGTYSDGSTEPLTSGVSWSAAGGSATINASSGLATAGAGGGATTVKATDGAVSADVTLNVSGATISSIAVSPSNPTAYVGQQMQFTAAATYSDGTVTTTGGVAWSSSGADVTIDAASGLAVADTSGTATITATGPGGSTGTSTVTVSASALQSIQITPPTMSLIKGATQQLAATGSYADGTTIDLTNTATWTPASTTVATVDATGLLTAAGVGNTTVSAAFGGVTSATTAAVTVTTAVLESIAVTPASPLPVASGQTVQFTATGTYSDGTTQNLTNSVVWASSSNAVATINTSPAANPGLATVVAAGGTLALYANSPGAWGNSLQAQVKVSSPTTFSLSIINASTGRVLESFTNLSVVSTNPQFVVTVINNDSQYVTFVNPGSLISLAPTAMPATSAPVAFSGGIDGAVLVPVSDGNFETALGADPVATNTYGVHLLDRVPIFNILCIPGENDAATVQKLQTYCADQRAFYIVDAPQLATTAKLNMTGPVGSDLSTTISGTNSDHSAYYYPWVQAPDPLFGNRPALFPPCGFVAGIYAATDAARGVWKAPAGIDAALTGVTGLQYNLTDPENGELNPQAINCLRQFRVYGDVVWGARTLQGSDEAGSQWKYVPIRRFALFLESSLYDGTQWVVFEPNDATLWGQIRLNIGSFMQGLFLQGAFQGTTPSQAYFVKCDGENNPQLSIDQGIVNITVGFAPLYPAEFVVIQIQQMAGLSPS